MNIFIIPSWYPSPNNLLPGRFFRDQTILYAKHFPDDRLVISHWGQNDDRLLVEAAQPNSWLNILRRKPGETIRELIPNCYEFFRPTYTWTRKLRKGNISAIIESCRLHLKGFEEEWGLPDLIHAHVAYPGGYVAQHLSKEFNIPYLITEHSGPFPPVSFPSTNGLNPFLYDPLKNAQKVLAVSKSLQTILNSYDIGSECFPNFIDDQLFRLSQEKKNEVFTFIHIGRLSPEKDQFTLLKAAAELTSLNFKLMIVGDGPMKKNLLKVKNELKLRDKVDFMGEMDQEGVLHQLQKADAFILSSTYENFPVSILEAMACGKPVISTRCGGPEEMITDQTGRLVELGNHKELATVMKKLISNEIEFDSKVIRNEFEERFGTKLAVDRLRTHYEQVVSSNSA